MKKILVAFVVIVIMSLTAFFALNMYVYNQKQAVEVTPQPEPMVVDDTLVSGVVTKVNLEQMAADGPAVVEVSLSNGEQKQIAIPSMNRPLCETTRLAAPEEAQVGDIVTALGTLGENGAVVPCGKNSHYFTIEGLVNNAALGLSFPYRKGPNGYVLQTDIEGMSVDPAFVQGYQLMLASDQVASSSENPPSEGPATLQVRVYENADKRSASVWAAEHPLETNIELALGAPRETVVGGANAVAYIADGLYASVVYVVAHGSYMYVFTGAYIDERSVQRVDLENLIGAVVFIPEISVEEPPAVAE